PRGGPEGADPFQGDGPRRRSRRAAGAVAAHRPHPSAARALCRDRLSHPRRPQVWWRGGALVGGGRFAPAAPACAAAHPAASVGQGHPAPAGRAAGAFQAHARSVRLLGDGRPMKIRIRIPWRRLIWMMAALLPVLAIGGVIWLTTRDLTRYQTRLTDQIRKVTGRELKASVPLSVKLG